MIALNIMEELQAALEQFATIAEDLKNKSAPAQRGSTDMNMGLAEGGDSES